VTDQFSQTLRMPAWAMKPLADLISTTLNLDPESPRRLEPLAGKVIAMEMAPFTEPVRFRFTDRGVAVSTDAIADEKPDARIRATPAALLAIAANRDRVGAEVEFSGDVAVVQALRHLIANLEIDWEEQLSKLTGDIAAHQIGNEVRRFDRWARQGVDTLTRNVGEYLTEEVRLLPSEAELSAFLDEVDRLRENADRLEARVSRMERSLRRDPAP